MNELAKEKQFSWRSGEWGFLTVGDQRLEACCWGPPPGQAPTVVLLHEGLGCVALWRNFPKKLAARTGFGIFAYSRQGYGRSTARAIKRPLDFMTIEAVDILPPVLDAIGFEHGILVGHSDGASIAAIHAGAMNDPRVKGIALMAPHFFIEEKTLSSIRQARQAFDHGDLKDKFARYHNDAKATFYGWSDAWLDPEFKHWDITNYLAGIKVPVLALQGADDQYGTIAQIEVISDMPGNRVKTHMLADCRHAPFLERPEITLSLIANFAQQSITR